MVDDPSANKGFGDTYELHRHHIPVATVISGVIGWHEMRKGQLLFAYPIGTQSDDQEDKIKTNLSTSQRSFMKPK